MAADDKHKKRALIIPIERLEIAEDTIAQQKELSTSVVPADSKATIVGLGPSFQSASALIRAELEDAPTTIKEGPLDSPAFLVQKPPAEQNLPWAKPATKSEAPTTEPPPVAQKAQTTKPVPKPDWLQKDPTPKVETPAKPEPKKPVALTKDSQPIAPNKTKTGLPSSSVAMLGPPAVGKTYYCKGLVQLFLRPERLNLHVENLTAIIRRGERSLPLEGYLERFKTGSRESPTAPAYGLNLHELLIDWGKEKRKDLSEESGRAAILLNDTAGEIFRNLDENQSLQRYVSSAETIWLLLPAWVLTLCETDVRGQVRSYRRAIRDFTDEVDWMYDHPEYMVGQRRFQLIWTMGNDPMVRAWGTEMGLYQDWLTTGEALRDRKFFGMARFVAFQKRLNKFLDHFISSTPELDLLQHGLSRLRKIGTLRHSLINVIDDLEVDGRAQEGGQEIKENLLHVEAPVLTLLSKTLTFGV
jgi:hypothetical protein